MIIFEDNEKNKTNILKEKHFGFSGYWHWHVLKSPRCCQMSTQLPGTNHSTWSYPTKLPNMITGKNHLQDHSTVDERKVLQQKVREVFKLSGYSEINAKNFRSKPFFSSWLVFFFLCRIQDWMRPGLTGLRWCFFRDVSGGATYTGRSPLGGRTRLM